jgi:putative permease
MVFLPIFKLVPLMQNEGEKLQYYLPKIESYVESTFFELKHKVKANTGLDLEEKYLYSLIGNSKDWVTNIILNIPSILGMLLEWVFIIPLFLFFLLKDGKVYRRLLLRLTPNTLFERAYYVTYQFNRKLGDYIFAKFFEATIVGGIIGIGLLILDVRFAITLGIIAAITNIIPYVGPLLGSAPAIIFGMIEYGSGTPIFYGICFLMLIANIIDMGLVFPLLVSKIVDLHPIVVVASVILGSQYWGLVGMIVSIPLAAAVKLIFIELYREIYAENIK